jgi:probable HAF family extracellular repeat protein
VGGEGISQALGINDSGEIVGYSKTTGGDTEAVLWSSTGVATNLGDVLGIDWTNTQATGINEAGDIVGFGSFMGSGDTAFLLIPTRGLPPSPAPIPEPSTWAMLLLGLGGLGFLGYRQTRKGQAATA